MSTNRLLYGLHRWLGLIGLVQLTVWSATGLVFSLLPIGKVRGEDTRASAPPQPIDWSRVRPLPPALQPGAVEVLLRTGDGALVYEVRRAEERILVDASTGMTLDIDAERAARIARADQQGEPTVVAVSRVDERPIEYRGGRVPAWRVDLADGRGTRVYVDAAVGTVTARRNDTWRAYDFLWGLHIMDYGGREDFNTAWLPLFAAVGLAAGVSGMVLWWMRAYRRWRRRAGALV